MKDMNEYKKIHQYPDCCSQKICSHFKSVLRQYLSDLMKTKAVFFVAIIRDPFIKCF